MKQKNILYLALLSLVSLLWSCSNDNEYLRPEPPVEDGYSVLKTKFEFPRPKNATYAAADYTADASEREIKSIAFITKTDDEGTPGQADFKQGELNKFFSHEDLRSATGLYEPVNITGNTYTTSIKIRSYGFGTNTKVTVIANYVENGITQKLQDLENYEDLTSIITPDATDNLATPLLMFAEETVQLASGATINQSFNLHRVVARIDVINDASDTDPDKGFVLTSAQLVNPRKHGYLAPGKLNETGDIRHSIPIATEFSAINANNAPLNEPLQVGCLYTYETANSGQANIPPTAVRVKGSYKGILFDKVIAIKQPDKDGNIGAPIMLERNFRYAIYLKPSLEPNQIDWTVKVAAWDDGEEVQVKPPQAKKPLLDNFQFTGFTPGTGEWNATTKVLDYTAHANSTDDLLVSFDASDAYFGTDFDITVLYDMVGSVLDIGNVHGTVYKDLVDPEDPVITYSSIKQKYNIKLPKKVAGTPDVPAGFMVRIMSSGNDDARDSIIFKIVPNYDNLALKPVLLGGKYWAPVNVGATTISTVANQSTQGFVYQWGRNANLPLVWDGNDGSGAGQNTYAGPVDYATANGAAKDKFITVSKSTPIKDWLNDDNNKNERNNQWTPSINNSPCPPGWRVPSSDELTLLLDRYNSANSEGRYEFILGDDPNVKLYLPRAGYLNYTNGATHGASTNSGSMRSLYWSYGFDSSGSPIVMDLHPGSGVPNVSSTFSCYAFAIRCIQQDVQDQRP